MKDSAANCTDQSNRVPNVLYDPREGRDRDDDADAAATPPYDANTIFLGGVMHYVELDITNLRIWLAEKRAANAIMETTGYVVYFSDRRSNHTGTGAETETGEYGFEDVVDRDNNDIVKTGEDINGMARRIRYGGQTADARCCPRALRRL